MMSFCLASTQAATASQNNATCKSGALATKVLAQCVMCHSISKSSVGRLGPSLYGVFGRKSGAVEGFRYSKAMKLAGLVWDAETLESFLIKPRKVVPKNKMAFAGVRDPEVRKSMVCALQELQQEHDENKKPS